MSRIITLLLLFCVTSLGAVEPAWAVNVDWVTVGDPGNAPDPADGDSRGSGVQNLGAVDHAYRIGKFEVTNAQYIDFLNTKDPIGTNRLGLYSPGMAGPYGGISFNDGNVEGEKYTLLPGRENHPVTKEPAMKRFILIALVLLAASTANAQYRRYTPNRLYTAPPIVPMPGYGLTPSGNYNPYYYGPYQYAPYQGTYQFNFNYGGW